MVFGFYLLHQLLYFAAARGLAGEMLYWGWGHQAIAAVANALLALLLYAAMDRFRSRT
jgi:hypothetical protein